MYQKVKSLERALKIMELLRERSIQNKYLSPGEAAASVHVSRVTAYNILNTLVDCGYVRHAGRGKYTACDRNAREIDWMPQLKAAAEPLLRQAASSGRESFLLVTLYNGKRMELLRLGKIKNSKQAIFEANSTPYSQRTARVILAWYKPEQLDFFIRHNGLPTRADWAEVDGNRAALMRELEKIRNFGGCCDIDAKQKLTATAVPVFGAGDEVIASLGCYSPVATTDFIRQKGLFLLLQEFARQIGKK